MKSLWRDEGMDELMPEKGIKGLSERRMTLPR